MPDRPRRRMPTLWTIANYWHDREDNPLLLDAEDIERPYCFACERVAPTVEAATPRERWIAATRYLDRAHLVDRYFDGLDGPQNLVPLCRRCHKHMPSFRVERGAEAILWVVSAGDRYIMQLLSVA